MRFASVRCDTLPAYLHPQGALNNARSRIAPKSVVTSKVKSTVWCHVAKCPKQHTNPNLETKIHVEDLNSSLKADTLQQELTVTADDDDEFWPQRSAQGETFMQLSSRRA